VVAACFGVRLLALVRLLGFLALIAAPAVLVWAG
jgi:hypothetical protein